MKMKMDGWSLSGKEIQDSGYLDDVNEFLEATCHISGTPLMMNKSYFFFLLSPDRKIGGMIRYYQIKDYYCFLDSIIIREELQRQGYGTELLRQFISRCKNVLKVKCIKLCAVNAEEFYIKQGFNYDDLGGDMVLRF
jgi:ribosomal protein S18 acetylase RimI-like enzyme